MANLQHKSSERTRLEATIAPRLRPGLRSGGRFHYLPAFALIFSRFCGSPTISTVSCAIAGDRGNPADRLGIGLQAAARRSGRRSIAPGRASSQSRRLGDLGRLVHLPLGDQFAGIRVQLGIASIALRTLAGSRARGPVVRTCLCPPAPCFILSGRPRYSCRSMKPLPSVSKKLNFLSTSTCPSRSRRTPPCVSVRPCSRRRRRSLRPGRLRRRPAVRLPSGGWTEGTGVCRGVSSSRRADSSETA